MAAEQTARQQLGNRASAHPVPPIPHVPKLPEFLKQRFPDQAAALEQYDADWEEFFKKQRQIGG